MDLARPLQIAIDHGASDRRRSGGSPRAVRVHDTDRTRPVARRRGLRAPLRRVAGRDLPRLGVHPEQPVDGLVRRRPTAPAAEDARR